MSTLAFTSLLGFWSFLTPLMGAPDEANHVDLVFHLAAGADYPAYDQRRIGTAAFVLLVSHSYVLDYDSKTGTSSRGTRTRASARSVPFDATFDDLGGDKSAHNWPNQLSQHPPFYYWSSSLALRGLRALPGAPFSMDHEVHFLRFLNVLLLGPLPLLAWATARRLGASDRVAVVASLVPLCIPQLVHVGSSVNNDNLFVAFGSLLAYFLAAVVTGDLRARRAVVVGLAAGAAWMTKGFGVLFPIWIVICYGSAVVATQRRRSGLASCALALGTTLIAGSWFTVRNLVKYGEPSPSLHAATTVAASFQPDPVAYARNFFPFLIQGFWGYFGYFYIQLGTLLTGLATVLLAITVLSAASGRPHLGDRSQQVAPRRILPILAIFPLLITFVAFVAYDLYLKTGDNKNFVQGRYLFAAVVSLAVAMAVGSTRLFGRWASGVVLTVALLLQGQGIRLALERWWAEPTDSLWTSFRALVAWNPWPIPLVGIATATTIVLTVVLLYGVTKSTVDSRVA